MTEKLPIPEPRPVDLIFPEKRKLKEQGKCPLCAEPITEFRDDLSRKEYGISGMCQKCQDRVFKE
jgi:formylmethanofuran dehydrogenase subunit E